ncbi:hypothetical protein BX285_7064 [Streptomyces sp. 1114.5]|uniref:hypothetical protein n=1 Tax=unclassified Streptomyces TaxID=2593676 RepID=UPI000BC9963A|nr:MULTISPECIES: hypothetical protein [unclassified Streptomyces]RKT08700.1 hypothetical protein BX285_7064 [Streptomyces sp. 1114.5]SOB78875.1 hypothetical protein SAMN06272789_0141 [Streptomyces sp. 1331.2]
MSAAELSASEVPQIASSSQSTDQHQGLAIGGNVGAVWRGWWTWTPGNGTFNLQIPWNVIGIDSTVVITASEIDANGNRFVGAAAFQVSSIAPGNGVVTFKINIGWGSPLPMRTDVAVFN